MNLEYGDVVLHPLYGEGVVVDPEVKIPRIDMMNTVLVFFVEDESLMLFSKSGYAIYPLNNDFFPLEKVE